jgi:hypothetical protein
LDVQWKKAIQRFVLNNLEELGQEDVDAWLAGEIEIAPLMEEPLKAMSQHRDMILREMHQMSPPEIFDRLVDERPELVFPDKNKAIVRIGKELEAIKLFLMNL